MKITHFQSQLQNEIKSQGAHFMYFADIAHLAESQNKNYPNAILLGIVLSREYLKAVASTPDFVKQMKANNGLKNDEFHLTELKTDCIADYIEGFLKSNGYQAYSQSENNIFKTGFYDQEHQSTPLPHKTIAVLAGLGWIGKHNLLITPEYGSAISMCTVLTDAPLETFVLEPLKSNCGDCTICEDACAVNALKGKTWKRNLSRDEIVDVSLCNTCYQCVVQCPWTQKYMRQ